MDEPTKQWETRRQMPSGLAQLLKRLENLKELLKAQLDQEEK